MKCLERDSEKKFSRTEVPLGAGGASWGRGLMALFGLPKRAINPVPTGTSSTFTYLILVNYLSTADGVFDFSV